MSDTFFWALVGGIVLFFVIFDIGDRAMDAERKLNTLKRKISTIRQDYNKQRNIYACSMNNAQIVEIDFFIQKLDKLIEYINE